MKKKALTGILVAILSFTSCSFFGLGSDSENDSGPSLTQLLDGIPDINIDLVVPETQTARYTYIDDPSDPFVEVEWIEEDIGIVYEGILSGIKNYISEYITDNSIQDKTAFSIEYPFSIGEYYEENYPNGEADEITFFLHAGKYEITDNGIKIYITFDIEDITLESTPEQPRIRMYIHHYLEEGHSEYTTDYLLSFTEMFDSLDHNFYRFDGENKKSIMYEEWDDEDENGVFRNTNYYEYEIVDTKYSNLKLVHNIVDTSNDNETSRNARVIYTREAGYHVWQKVERFDDRNETLEDTLFYNLSDGTLDASYSDWPADFVNAQTEWPEYAWEQVDKYDINSILPASDSPGFADLF